ncbi:SusC/RagA family TonB-linked outer membrane protein [Mucilaginibacter sp. PAMB04168]|uniref:SusC/RagA family TonB-linked outer membrane protein n=1 Tax=Mucilaginibacter sp. PAMB04168 TaxID=3138567 RepID=UPI0031F6273D
MKKILLVIGLVFFSVTVIVAQSNIVITGKITDENNEAVVGATISLQNGQRSTTTTVNGSYSITVANTNAVLVITSIGYKTQAIKVGANKVVDVKLVPDVATLKEVVVTGALGIQTQAKAVTYASQSVNMNSMNENRDINIVNSLAGKVAGIQVTSTGQPGSSSRVILRGESSVSGNNQPLWVVDGVPIENQMGDSFGNNLDYGNGAADLNPNDIESIEVLKGANAAALYGQRAANGAILVTTKKAKIGDKSFGVTFNQNSQVYAISEFPAYQNVYGEGTNTRLVTNNAAIFGTTGAVNMGTSNVSWGAPMLGQPFNTFSGQPHGYNPQPNNIRDLYQKSVASVTNISVNKADQSSAFRLSYTFTSGNDVIANQNLKKKHNLNFNASRKLGDKLTVESRVAYTNDDTKNRTARNLDPNSPMSAYVFMTRSADVAAFDPWKDANGRSVQRANLASAENPLWVINENQNNDKHTRLIGGVTVTGQLTKNLKVRANVAGDLDYGRSFIYREIGARLDTNGYYQNANYASQNWIYEGLMTYNKDFGKNFKFTANFGGNIQSYSYTRSTNTVEALQVQDKPTISNANAFPTSTEAPRSSQINSLLGFATLGYKDFLFLNVTGRNDWSSMLPSNARSFFYPSIGGSFLFSNFLKDNAIISFGKLRASLAIVGNSGQPYQLLNGYNSTGLFLNNPVLSYEQSLKNFNLKPERKSSKEIGVDMGFFKDKISLNVTLYQDNTTNQILTANTPYETGYTTRVLNSGEIRNRGIEVSMGGVPVRTKDFAWSVNVNFSRNINKVLSLSEGVPSRALGGQVLGVTTYAEVGQPYGVIRGSGPYMVGDKVLVSANGRVQPELNLAFGSFRPDWLGSFQTGFKYRGFDLSALTTVKWGGLIYSATYGRANGNGTTIQTLDPMFGREEWLFSRGILGENGNESSGIGLTVGGKATAYEDAERRKGGQYPNSYFVQTQNGAIVYGPDGRILPGAKNNSYVDPQLLANDMVLNNVPAITFDATSIRISELTVGYTVPPKYLARVGNSFIKSARLALIARNPFIIYNKTPRGIDPEASYSTGNQQGIDNGGSFPYRQYGFDFRVSF